MKPVSPNIDARQLQQRAKRPPMQRRFGQRGKRGEQVRRVVSRGHSGFVGYFPSRKSERSVEFESLLERDFLVLAEVNSNVTEILAQPIEIPWSDAGKPRIHIPDFRIQYKGRQIYVEVKTAKQAAEPQIAARTRIITRQLAKKGEIYRLVTDETIRREPALTNANRLLSGLAHEPSEAEQAAVIGLLRAHGTPLSVREIRLELGLSIEFANSLYALVLNRALVQADPSEPVGLDMRLDVHPDLRGRS